jgi:hypothetical protein
MRVHEAVPGWRAEAPRALAANLAGGHLVVPTYLIADVRRFFLAHRRWASTS